MPEARGRLVPVVVAGLGSGGLAAIAGNQDWASIDRGGDPTATAFSSAAASSICRRASALARITALPTRCVPREAKEPMSCGPVSLSAVST